MGKKNIIRKDTSIAKISPPSAVGIFPRERLFRLLDEGRDSPIIYLSSQPGSGKTALVASYLEVRKLPCLWYRIDVGDADIATFFYYMGIAAQQVVAKKMKPLPLFRSEYVLGMPVFTIRYFENLYSRLISLYPPLEKMGIKRALEKGRRDKRLRKGEDKRGFVIVFDNYQDVPESSVFHEMLSYGLDMIPEGINVIVLSRRELLPQFARLQANNKIHFLGWDEIKFTPEETKELVRLKKQEKLTDETLFQVYRKTDGWVAGIVLMLEGFKMKNLDLRLFDNVLQEGIFDYFKNEIFEKKDWDTQEFLLRTAFFPRMTSQMAEKLTAKSISQKMLSDLNKNHYFIDIYPQDKLVYQYHPLFREFLLSRAEVTFSDKKISEIKKRSANLLEESGQIEEAARVFHECNDIIGLTRLVYKWAQDLVAQGRNQTVLEWLDFIPFEKLEDDAWLLYWRGACFLPINQVESLVNFEKAFLKFKAKKDISGLFLAWSGIAESIMYGKDGLKPLDKWVPILDELVEKFKKFPSEQSEVNVVCSMIRVLSLRRPESVDMGKWVDRIHAIAQKSTNVPMKIKALINLACFQYSEGNLQGLRITIESLSELLQRTDVSHLARLTFDWVKAAYFNSTSMYDQCQKVVSSGIELAHSLRIYLMEYLLMGHGVLISLKTGNLLAAKNYLQQMVSTLSMVKPWEASFYYYVAAWEAMYRGDLARASIHAERCLKSSEYVGNPWPLSMAHLLRASVSHAFEEEEQAADHLKKACTIGLKSKNEFTHFICLLTEAYFSLGKGMEAVALEAIRKGMLIGKKNGYVNVFMWLPGLMETVLAKALEHGIEVRYAQELVRRNALTADISCSEIENWPWPLKVYTLERFALLKDDKPIQFSRKSHPKPLYMLKALIALGGRDVREEQIADLLWPEAEGDVAHNAFTTTLSRLRQLLGIEKAIRFQEGKITLDPRYCWVDAWAFERIVGQAESLWRKDIEDATAEAVRLSEKAINIYRGHFLAADKEHPWTFSYRERLRSKFLSLISKLGDYLERTGQFEKAVDNYREALEVDDLTELFYQNLMVCYQQLGQKAEAVKIYERCRNTLSSVLGIEPSPKTEVIYKALLLEK